MCTSLCSRSRWPHLTGLIASCSAVLCLELALELPSGNWEALAMLVTLDLHFPTSFAQCFPKSAKGIKVQPSLQVPTRSMWDYKFDLQ